MVGIIGEPLYVTAIFMVIGAVLGMLWVLRDWHRAFGKADDAPAWAGGLAGILVGYIWFVTFPILGLVTFFKGMDFFVNFSPSF